jgi:hypothetical protein
MTLLRALCHRALDIGPSGSSSDFRITPLLQAFPAASGPVTASTMGDQMQKTFRLQRWDRHGFKPCSVNPTVFDFFLL